MGGIESVSLVIDSITKNPCFQSVDVSLERMDSVTSYFHVIHHFVYSGDVAQNSSWSGAGPAGMSTFELMARATRIEELLYLRAT